jgi:hypothetical protein
MSWLRGLNAATSSSFLMPRASCQELFIYKKRIQPDSHAQEEAALHPCPACLWQSPHTACTCGPKKDWHV